MSNAQGALVVGGQGIIGSALAARLRSTGRTILTTTRRKDRDGLFLDLQQPEAFEVPDTIGVAYLCAAVARIEACKNDPLASRRTNVDGMAAVSRRLAEHGVFVVFLSTNQVFDGENPNCQVDHPYAPRTEYGRQKADAERAIASLGDSSAIVRLTKVLEPKVPLFAQWRTTLSAGQPIEPFTDMWMAPVPLDHVLTSLTRIGEGRHPGIFHVSGDRDISYADTAREAARLWRCDDRLVHPTSAVETGRFKEFIPRYTSLDVSRLRKIGVAPPSVDATLVTALKAA